MRSFIYSTLSICFFFTSLSTQLYADNKTITLLHLNDLHAHLTAHKEIDHLSGKITERGGIARIATTVKAIRQENPNTILMNIGDTYHGGVEAFFTQGNAIVEPVNALNIDVGVPGNWDFAYGPGVTRQRYSSNRAFLTPQQEILQPNFPNLAANVYNAFSRPGVDELFLPATLIKEMAGIKIGFIGITSDIVERMHPSLAMSFRFLTKEQEYIDLINQYSSELRQQGANIVIVMSELGIQKDFNLANKIQGNLVDVFFSAHTHEATFEALQGRSGALVVEAGNDTYLGRMDITINMDNDTILSRDWTLLVMDNSIPEDKHVKQLVSIARKPFLEPSVNMTNDSLTGQTLAMPINTVIATTDKPLFRRHALENQFNNAFADMLKQFTQTDIAITPGFRFDSVIPEKNAWLEDNTLASGDITLEDVYRFFPVPFTLSTGQVSGKRLQEIIESNLSAVFSTKIFTQSGGWVDGFSGIDLTVDLEQADEQRIQTIQLTDSQKHIDDNDVLTVAGCTRPFDLNSRTTLCSYSGFTGVEPLLNPDTNENWTAINFLVYALKNGFLTTKDRQNITDISNTPLWPDGNFYQPISGVGKSSVFKAIVNTADMVKNNSINLNKNDTFSIEAIINIPDEHLRQAQNLLVGVNFKNTSDIETWFFKNNAEQWQVWTGNEAFSVAINGILPEHLNYKVFSGQLHTPGAYRVWLGYQLNDGSIIHSGEAVLTLRV